MYFILCLTYEIIIGEEENACVVFWIILKAQDTTLNFNFIYSILNWRCIRPLGLRQYIWYPELTLWAKLKNLNSIITNETNYGKLFEDTEQIGAYIFFSRIFTSIFKLLTNIFKSFILGTLLDKHLAYLTFWKVYCVHPVSLIWGFSETILGHVKYWDHISMRHKHVHWKVHYLGIDLEVIGNTLMQNSVPLRRILFQTWCAETYSISPEVANLPNLNFFLKFVLSYSPVDCFFFNIFIIGGTCAPATTSLINLLIYFMIVDKL